MIRIGFGFDVHQLSADRAMILGGVEIPAERGILGHSDADVLLHAICDALLGALALGDIGKHFPDTDDTYKNADSRVLLRNVFELIKGKGYRVGNIDTTVVLEAPKILRYAPQMQEVIGEILELESDAISIKATTNETMGFIGRKEGVTAYAVCLLMKR